MPWFLRKVVIPYVLARRYPGCVLDCILCLSVFIPSIYPQILEVLPVRALMTVLRSTIPIMLVNVVHPLCFLYLFAHATPPRGSTESLAQTSSIKYIKMTPTKHPSLRQYGTQTRIMMSLLLDNIRLWPRESFVPPEPPINHRDSLNGNV